MTTALTLLALAHVAALAGVLAAARWSTVLVDDHGFPMAADWCEATIPAAEDARVAR